MQCFFLPKIQCIVKWDRPHYLWKTVYHVLYSKILEDKFVMCANKKQTSIRHFRFCKYRLPNNLDFCQVSFIIFGEMLSPFHS